VPLDPFQADVAQIALAAAEGHDFALAGGNALIAHGLVSRVTEDVDLFTTRAGGPGHVTQAVVAALRAGGCEVTVRRTSTDGDFTRLAVGRDGRWTQLELARDWRAHAAVRLGIGPVLHVEDAIANKVCAMIGRSLPRDYIDVAGAAASTTRAELLRTAFEHDPGLRVEDVTGAMHQLDQLRTEDFARYGLDEDAVAHIRATFVDWPRDPAADDEGHAVHTGASRA